MLSVTGRGAKLSPYALQSRAAHEGGMYQAAMPEVLRY
jgi:hypothetical protein